MQAKPQRNIPAVRARHGKRLPQFSLDPTVDTDEDDDDDGQDNIPGPVTLTITEARQPSPSIPIILPPILPTVTVFVTTTPPPSSSSSVLLSTSSSPTPSSFSMTVVIPTPSASANNNGTMQNEKNYNMPQSAAAASQGIPTGSIIGIVVAVSLVLIAAIIFLVRRRRSARNRLRLKGWMNKGTAPSFLWIEPKDKDGNANTYPSTPGARGGETSPGVFFAGSQSRALNSSSNFGYTSPSAPSRPPLAHSAQPSYDRGYSPSPLVSSPAVPAALRPGFSPSAQTAYATSSPESATVKSTFIPTLPDELSIAAGEVIRILSEYDDGWALCSNARGEVGMVPLECLDRGVGSQAQKGGQRSYRNLSRASSLAASPKPYGGISGRY